MQKFRALWAKPPDPRASGRWGLCPQTPSLWRLGALPPDPHWPPATGGSAPRPPKQPSIANFCLRAWPKTPHSKVEVNLFCKDTSPLGN